MSRKLSNWALLVVGIAVAIFGAFLGMSTAINDAAYVKLLEWWLALVIFGSILLGAATMRGSKPVRLIAIGFLSLTWAFGVDPAIRLFHLLSR
jgi:hypothetical protein